jgi:hypothetical protein
MRQGLVSQNIAAGNASFVEVFSHEALSGALHHDLRFGPYRYWHGRNCRPTPINVASFTGASPSRHTRSRDHKGLDFYSRLADELLAAGSSTFIGGRAGRNHARLTTGRMSPPGTKRTGRDGLLFPREADMPRPPAVYRQVANDPKRTRASSKSCSIHEASRVHHAYRPGGSVPLTSVSGHIPSSA